MADFKHAFIDAYEGTTGAVSVNGGDVDARVRQVICHWAKTAAQTDGDQIFLIPVKSSDRVTGIYVQNDALTGASDINIGLYDTDASTDVDENLFADAISIASAATSWTQIDEIAPENNGKPIWSLLGGTSPEDKTYYLALNLVTGGTAAGDVAIRVDFAV